MSRTRGFAFTVNNYTDDDLDRLLDLSFVYMILGFQEAPSTGTSHIQGYIYYHNKRSQRVVQKDIPRGRVRHAKGSPQQNQTYCSKECEFYEYGELPINGRVKKAQLEEIMENPRAHFHLWNQYRRGYKELLEQESRKDPKREKSISFVKKSKLIKELPDDMTIFLDDDIATYRNEDILVLSVYHSFNIEYWISGYPPRVKRGYEIIDVDPDIIYITYSDAKEYAYLVKKYSDYI